MNFDLYIFEYSTKSCGHKLISYLTYSYHRAFRRFTKNTRCTKLIRVLKNGSLIYAI